MRIDYLTSVRLNEPGAPTNHVLGGCAGFIAHGHRLSLLHPHPRVHDWREIAGDAEYAPHDHTYWWPHVRGGWRLFEFCVSRAVLQRDRSEAAPDIIYLRFSPSRLLARALRRTRTPKVLELNGFGSDGLKSSGPLLDAVDLILVDGEPMREQFCGLCPEYQHKVRAHVIGATNCRLFRPLDRSQTRRDLQIPADARVIVHTSGFQPHHDFATIIGALRELRAQDSRYRLLLLGYGPLWNAVRADVSDLLASQAVVMPGAVEISRLPAYINAADVCVNSQKQWSLQQGNQRAFKIYEYMACERPTVHNVDQSLPIPAWASRCLGLIPAESVAALSAMIRQIAESPEQWTARCRQARQYVVANCSWPAVVRTTLDRIEEFLAGRDRRP